MDAQGFTPKSDQRIVGQLADGSAVIGLVAEGRIVCIEAQVGAHTASIYWHKPQGSAAVTDWLVEFSNKHGDVIAEYPTETISDRPWEHNWRLRRIAKSGAVDTLLAIAQARA